MSRGVGSASHLRAAPGWMQAALAACVALVATALALGAAALLQPLGPDNSVPDLYYPSYFAPASVIFVLLAVYLARRRPGNRWATILAGLGVAWAINSVLVSARGYADTEAGATLPQTAIAWLENWWYLFNDFGTLILLVLLLPDGRLPSPRWRPFVGLIGAGTAVIVLAGMFAPRALDNTHTPNPLGLTFAPWLDDLPNPVYFLILLVGLVGLITRLVLQARRRDAEATRLARWGALILTAEIAAFVMGGILMDASPVIGECFVMCSMLAPALLGTAAIVSRRVEATRAAALRDRLEFARSIS